MFLRHTGGHWMETMPKAKNALSPILNNSQMQVSKRLITSNYEVSHINFDVSSFTFLYGFFGAIFRSLKLYLNTLRKTPIRKNQSSKLSCQPTLCSCQSWVVVDDLTLPLCQNIGKKMVEICC